MRGAVLIMLGALIMSCAPSPPAKLRASGSDPAVAYANALSADGSPYREGFSGTGDDQIHYVEAGSGPVVLFVHGFPSFWYVWRDQMEALRKCRRVIAIDAPGAGLSAKPYRDEAYRIDRLARRLDTLIDELAPGEKVTLVGHDWGGALVWSYAKWNSKRLDRLAVFSAPPYDLLLDLLANDPEQRSASLYMDRLRAIDRETTNSEGFAKYFYDLAYKRMTDEGVLDPQESALFAQALSRPGALYAGIQWYKANIPASDQIELERDAWPAINVRAELPVLLINGSDDRTFVKHMGDRAQAHARSLKVTSFEEVGHWTMFQKPELANRALAEFVLNGAPHCPD